jgi:hypothetical protein
MLETSLQQIFALVPMTVSRYLHFARKILLDTLRSMDEASVQWPTTHKEFDYYSALIQVRHSLLDGAFGSIDGLNLPVQEPDDPLVENSMYNGWKCTHFVSNVLVFSPRGAWFYVRFIACCSRSLLPGTIIDAVLNAPRSWHDSVVARPIFRRLETVPQGYYLVADSAFPQGGRAIPGRICAPLKSGQSVPRDPVQQERVLKFNRQLLSYCQTAEWGMRTMQGSFGRLRVPLNILSTTDRQELLELCVLLFNVRANCVGISQIKNVYEPIWRESEDDQLWSDLDNMVFGEIRRRDRVSQYHLIVVNDE